jgi:signal transduction histidine kinase
LVEAIQYLVHNAIKFNKIGGRVKIECAPAGNELYLHVHDTGVGIPEQRLEGIWSGLGHRQNGSPRLSSPGLGLALTRFIIRAHGGRVEAQSRYGSGSTFTIYLPLVLDR